MRRGTRGSSRLSQVSANDPCNLVLSPAIVVQTDNATKQGTFQSTLVEPGQHASDPIPVSMNRGMSPVITGSDLMGYVKRNSKNDDNAKVSAQKVRMQNRRDLNCGSNHNRNQQIAMNTVPIRGKSPLITQRKNSHNMDLVHMNMATQLEQQPIPLTQGEITAKKSVYISEFDAPQQIIMNPALQQNIEIGASTTKNRTPATNYARFKLQESIKALARPKQVPICGPRLRELSNIVFEQQVAQGFNVSISAKHKQEAHTNKEHQQLNNDNFTGPFYMTQNFHSHKVGDQYQEARQQPYHLKVEVAPKTIRPQSHYSRECQQQMSAVDIIREQHIIASQSSRLIFRPQSGRNLQSFARGSTQRTSKNNLQSMPQTNTIASATLGITTDGNGRASLQPISQMVAQQMASATVTDYADPYRGQLASQSLQNQGSTTLNLNQRRNSHIKSGNVSIKQLLSNPTSSGSMKYQTKCQTVKHGNQAKRHQQTVTFQMRVNSAKHQPSHLRGDELKVAPKKIFDGADAVSRQSRFEAYETEKLQIAYAAEQRTVQAKVTMRREEDRQQDITDNHMDKINKTVLSRNALASRASTSRVETPHADLTKNVTVFDKIVMPPMVEMSEVVRSDVLTPDKHDTINTTMVLVDGNGFGIGQQTGGGIQVGSYRRNNMDSTELYLSSNDGIVDAKDYLNPKNSVGDNITELYQGRSPFEQKKEEPYSNLNRAHQYSEPLNLDKKLDQVVGNNSSTAPQAIQGLQDLKSISSGGRHLLTSQGANSHSPVSRRELVRIAPNVSCSNPNIMTKSRLNRLRQEERRCKVQKSVHQHKSGDHKCKRCTGLEIEATKKQVDKGYMSTGRTKVYFKPSVVEIHDQSTAIRSSSPPPNELDGQTRAHKQQCYILGPNQSQENFLGAIREESQAAMLHPSQEDSTVMQALLQACEDGPQNLNEIADNPETREFILYLQQVQPDLLIRQHNQSSRSVTDRKMTLQSGISEEAGQMVTPFQEKRQLLQHNSEGKDFKSTLKLVNKKSSKDIIKTRNTSMSPQQTQLMASKPSSDHLVEVMTAYRTHGCDPATQVILEETIQENCMRSSLGNGEVIDTERNRVNSTNVINSQETLGAQSPRSTREPNDAAFTQGLTQPHMLLKDGNNPGDVIQSVTLNVELEDQTLRTSLSKKQNLEDEQIPRPIQQIEIKEDVKIVQQPQQQTEPTIDYKFDDEPVNYDGQVNMMQDIFRQISNQRANATRTTVKGQKVIFQPNCREFRKLDLKPVHVDTRRYPPRPDSMIPQPRPQPKVMGRQSRNSQRRHARTKEQARTSIQDSGMNLKLENRQVGIRGQFASLLNRKRAEKMVTWDTEPPQMTQHHYSYSQHTGQTTGRSAYYQDQKYQQHPQCASEDFYAYQQQLQAKQDGYVDPQLAYADSNNQEAGSKPQMSAIREVSSVSHHNDTVAGSVSGRLNAHSYREMEPEVRDVVHGMMNEKSKSLHKPTDESINVQQQQIGAPITHQSQQQAADNASVPTQPADESTQITHITGWTGRQTPHRRGKPVGAETMSKHSMDTDCAQSNKKSGGEDDTFAELFYNKEQAEAFKAGKAGGDETAAEQLETVEWSDDSGCKNRDENGKVMTHKGNVIRRGFNVEKQKKERVVSTNDPRLLHHATLQHLFDDNKHRMSNYIGKIGPPKKKRSDMNKQQWRRIQKAGFTYENLEEKTKVKRNKPHSASSGKLGHHEKQKKYKKSAQPATITEEPNKAIKLPSSSQLKGDQISGEQVIEGNLFRFDNPDRYKSDQLREQALALLVPGYLQYVYDIN